MSSISSTLHKEHRAADRIRIVQTVVGVFLSVTWIAVALRLWVRGRLIKSIGWDDWMMLLTNTIFTLYCAFTLEIMQAGGVPLMLDELPLDKLAVMSQYITVCVALYVATTAAFKIALGLFYLRIVILPWQRYVIYGTMTMSTIYGIVFFFYAIFFCGNPAKLLVHEVQHKCGPQSRPVAINLSGGAINACGDWIYAILPIFVLLKSTIPRPAKLSAGCIMLLGVLGSACSVIRLGFIKDFVPGPNFFMNSTIFTILFVTECGIGITAASLATLRPLFRSCTEGARSAWGPTFSGRYRNASTSESTRRFARRDNMAPLPVDLGYRGRAEKVSVFDQALEDDRTTTMSMSEEQWRERGFRDCLGNERSPVDAHPVSDADHYMA